MPLVPYPNPQKVGKIQKKFGFFPYKSKNDGLQEKTYRPSHLVRPQGLVGSPKASVIASHASCLAKKDERQPGVPGFATQCVVQHSCKVPDDIKKTTALLLLFVYVRQNLVFRAIFESVSNEKVTNDFSISVSFALF